MTNTPWGNVLGISFALTLTGVGCGEAFSASSALPAQGGAGGQSLGGGGATGGGATGGGATGGGATGGGATGGGATAGAGGGATGGGGSVGEICANGTDDDDDDAIDCLDDECSTVGYACVEVPAPWALATRVAGAGSDCAAPWGSLVAAGGSFFAADPLECSCTCGASSLVVCSIVLPTVVAHSAGNCATAGTSVTTGHTCTASNVAGANSIYVGSVGATGGACNAEQTTVDGSPPVQITNPARLCGPSAAGVACGDSAQCAPPATQRCVYRSGVYQECPEGYPERDELLADPFDDRSCGCSCTPGQSCIPSLGLYQDPICGGAEITLEGSGCHTLSSSTAFSATIVTVEPPGCGDPVISHDGGVTPAAAYTVCCTTS